MTDQIRADDTVELQALKQGDREADQQPDGEGTASQSRRSFIKTATIATGGAALGAFGDGVMHELDLVKPAHAAEGGIEGVSKAHRWPGNGGRPVGARAIRLVPPTT
ncbi:MAG: twin-arginine translocation signal domain-containing protein [Alphaproteobacteria bacterium]|nr:twin-arginine translocation signal domain-containing protein [Alphaproteobacteria bacterium]